MIRAFYATASGLVAQSTRQDVIANNIANVQTPGFKRQSLVSSSFKAVLAREDATLEDKQRPPYPGSPVNPVMVQMIANMRSFEANQRVISSIDQTLDKLINEAGRV